MEAAIDYKRLDPYYHDVYRDIFGAQTERSPRWSVAFLHEFQKRNMYAVDAIMRRYPGIVNMIGFTSKTCGGAYGMPVWQHIANEIKEHRGERSFRDLTALVARLGPMDRRSTYMLCFGIRGNWIDLVREGLQLGIDKEMLPDRENVEDDTLPEIMTLIQHYKTGVPQAAAANEKEEEKEDDAECVICMAAPAVFQLPCAHICMCKVCEKKLNEKLCPMCRTAY